MSEVIVALLDPEVLVAFLGFVVGPIVLVLIGARKEDKANAEKVLSGEPAKGDKGRITGERRIRHGDSLVIETFAGELTRLREEVDGLKREVAQVRRANVTLRQHNRVLVEQLVRVGETPFPAPKLDESS